MKHLDHCLVSAMLNSVDYSKLEHKVANRLLNREKSSPFAVQGTATGRLRTSTSAPRIKEYERDWHFNLMYGVGSEQLMQILQTPEEKQRMKHEDFWIENTGVCPVPKGTRVDTKHNDGRITHGGLALVPDTGEGSPYSPVTWQHYGQGGGITHWRPSDLSAWILGPLHNDQIPAGTVVESQSMRNRFPSSGIGNCISGAWRLVPPNRAIKPTTPAPTFAQPLPAVAQPDVWVYRADGEAFPNGYWFAQVSGSHEHKGERIVQLDGTSSMPASRLVFYKDGIDKAEVAKAQARALGIYWTGTQDRPNVIAEAKKRHDNAARIEELQAELDQLRSLV